MMPSWREGLGDPQAAALDDLKDRLGDLQIRTGAATRTSCCASSPRGAGTPPAASGCCAARPPTPPNRSPTVRTPNGRHVHGHGHFGTLRRCWAVCRPAGTAGDYVRWRAEERLDSGLPPVLPPDLPTRGALLGFQGVDQGGRPIYWERLDTAGVRWVLAHMDVRSTLQWHTYIMERGRELCHALAADSTVMVCDCQDIGPSMLLNWKALTIARQVVSMDERWYPECFHRVFVVNAPPGFATVWGWLRPLLPLVLAQRVTFLGHNFHPTLCNALGITDTPAEFAGRGRPLARLPLDRAAWDRYKSTEVLDTLSGNGVQPPKAV
eukprot:EG_transcript_13990